LDNAWLKSTMARENHRFRHLRFFNPHFSYKLYPIILMDLALPYVLGGFGTLCAYDQWGQMPGIVGAGTKGDAP
jgi:hypothetical protein